MPQNHDTRNCQPYVHIEQVVINNPASGTPSVEYVERTAFVSPGGQVRFLDDTPVRRVLQINPPALADRISLVDKVSGVTVEGSTSLGEALDSVNAVIRNDERNLDNV